MFDISKDPCLICIERNIWEHSLVPDPPDVFCGSQNFILVLEITPGEAFTTLGLRPILAGTDGTGKEEFVAAVMYANEALSGPTNILFHAFTTVTEGATTVEYLDENEEDVEQNLLDKGLLDVTGHCYWMSDRRNYVFKSN